MNQIAFYQHPFFDVFVGTKLTQWKTAHKEGDVQEVWDAQLAKNVIHIGGITPASNYMQVPGSKNLPKHSLGLTGKYIYLVVKCAQGKTFVCHLDFVLNETRTVCISLSNIYKDFKSVNGTSIQIPTHLQPDKWTVIALNALTFFNENKCFASGTSSKFYLRSFKLQASLTVKGVYTSDIAYSTTTLPKDIQLKLPKDKDWFAEYAWLQLPASELVQEQVERKAQTATNFASKQGLEQGINADLDMVARTTTKSNLKNIKSKPPRPTSSDSDKRVTFPTLGSVNELAGIQEEQQTQMATTAATSTIKRPSSAKPQNKKGAKKPQTRLEEQKQATKTVRPEQTASKASSENELTKLRAASEDRKQKQLEIKQAQYAALVEENRLKLDVTAQEVDHIKETHNFNLESKNIVQSAQVTTFHEAGVYDPKKSQKRNCENFVLKPDPIMMLDRVIGMHPRFAAGQVYFNKDPKLASEILFCQANLMLGYHAALQKQRLFEDKATTSIEHMLVVRGFALVFCKKASSATANRGNKSDQDIMVTVWDLDENERPLFSFRPSLGKLRTVSVSADGQMLSMSGKDFQGRELILVYSFTDIVKHQKVELLGRQLCDFDLVSLKFSTVISNCMVGCGRENIRFFKVKNNFMPSQLVSLNNTARGKVFNNSATAYKFDEIKQIRKPTTVYCSTECGLIYFVNYFSRQIDKIIQAHEDTLACLMAAPIKADQTAMTYLFTASQNGTLRIWSGDFAKLISEVSINQEVSSCDISQDQNQIAILSKDGTLSLLELEASSFKVLMRSHQDEIIDLVINNMSGCLVSIGKDSSIKVWLAETMEQVHEFNTSEHDPPTAVASSSKNAFVAVGFKSGFLRVFDMTERKMIHETMVFESCIMDISFAKNGKFMAVFFKNGRIVIVNVEFEFTPVKNIDYEFPNGNYFSVDFSPDGCLLANISSNANTITVWETKNFSLRHYCDFTGEIISKIAFAPNGRDLLVITTNSKLKILRLPDEGVQSTELQLVREHYGLTDQECADFAIAQNGKYIFAAGKEGLLRVYDYFLRGQVTAAQQSFTGHLEFPRKVVISEDLRYVFSTGKGNGIYRWAFFGDKTMPDDISVQFELTQEEIERQEAKEKQINLPVFDHQQLATYTEQQVAQMREQIAGQKHLNQSAITGTAQLPRAHQDLLMDGGLSLTRRPKVEYTPAGYVLERHNIALQKVLGCSIFPKVRDNLLWHKKKHFLAYTMQNILIFESLNLQKTQVIKNEVNDVISGLKLSPDERLMLAYTKQGSIDGFPQIIVWDTSSRRKVSQIAIDDQEIVSVEFSNSSNLLLVVSFNRNASQPRSQIAVWDFLDGRKEYLSKSVVAEQILEAKWNTFIKTSADEFVTISPQKYAYWRITQNLHMDTQTGMMPKDPYFTAANKDARFTCLSFVEPMVEQNSVYLLLGVSNGAVWVVDTRMNYFLYKFDILQCAIGKITSTANRIILEGTEDTYLHCWDLKKTIGDFDYDASDPEYFFSGPEKKLQLDGFPSASHYDFTAAEAIFISTNGSFWLVNFIEQLTVKLKSCHDPSHDLSALDFKYVTPSQFNPEQQTAAGADSSYEFDQNYLVGSTGRDGVVKVWQLVDLEHNVNFIVPKEQCLCVAMHQFKPFLVSSFSDGYIRFFDLQEGRNLGRCLIQSASEEPDPATGKLDPVDYCVHMKILPSGNHILCATKNGQVILIHIETWQPLAIGLQNLVSLNIPVNAFDVSFLEPYNKWLIGSSTGKILVYNRQDCNAFKQELFDRTTPPTFIFMDSFNAQEYVDNYFTETKKVNTLDHYYSIAKRNIVHNEKTPENETEAVFLNNDLASYICFVRKSSNLFIRNFELHQVVKRIQLDCLVTSMQIAPGSAPYVFLIGDNNSLQMLDFVNEDNCTKIKTIHDRVRLMKVCPNGRYCLTAGDKGEIIIYSVRRQRPGAEAPEIPQRNGTVAIRDGAFVTSQ